MTLGALGCIHFHWTARRLEDRGGAVAKKLACYLGAALCCLAACLSNAVGAVIPLLVAMGDLLFLPKPKLRRILCGTAALWAIGATTIVIKSLGPEYHTVAVEPAAVWAELDKLGYAGEHVTTEVGAFSAERLMLVLQVYWLNLRSLVWPDNLAIHYGRATSQCLQPTLAIMGGALLTISIACVWILRRRTAILFGVLWFGLALGVTSQIMPHHLLRADRFLYLPLAGLVLAVAMGWRTLGNALKGPARLTMAAAVALTLALLGARTALQVQTWRSSVAVWEHCVKVVPENDLAHRILADNLAAAGEYQRAFQQYRIALRLNLDPNTLLNFSGKLATASDKTQRDYELAIRLAELACEFTQRKDPKAIRTLATIYNNRANERRERGETVQAIEDYRKATQTDPNYVSPLFNLALLLATCSDGSLQDPEEAVRLVERAGALAERLDPNTVMITALVYDKAGQRDQAISTMERAISAAEAEGNIELATTFRGRLSLYRSQFPKPAARP
jgi:tetratricopeptide (TPR) repeat protein